MHYRYFLEAKGYLAQSERWQLYLLANSLHKDAKIVNIGVEYGASTIALRQGNKTAYICGVDLDTSKFAPPPDIDGRPVLMVQGDSSAAGRDWTGGALDLLFIDGDHSYAGCKADIDAWFPHIAPGGIIAFHDSGAPQCAGVNQAISEWYAGVTGWIELPRAGTIRSFKHTLPLAVLIPTFNRPSIVQRTVDQLLSNLRYQGQLLIYVGDDSDNDDTKRALHGYPAAMVVPAPKRGLGANLNMLLKTTSEQLIVQMDDDHQLIAPLDLTPHADKLIRETEAGWIHLMMNAQLNEHWDVSDFSLRGDDLRHWRIMPDSPCRFLASNQPHIKHRRVHDFYGIYGEPKKTWEAETEFNERVQAMHREKPDEAPRFYVPVEAYGFRHWRHVGDSYPQRGL